MSIFSKIKALFNKVVSWFSGMLAKNDSLVKTAAPIAVKVLNIIKNANAEGCIDVIGFILSSVGAKWGNSAASVVSKWIDSNIDKIITGCGIAEKAAQSDNVNVKLKLISEYLSTLDIDAKGVKISEIAALLAKSLDDSKLSVVEIVAIVTAIYKTDITI